MNYKQNARLLVFSKLLKVIAKIAGMILIFYGFFLGILGIGPDGEVSIQPRIIGLAVLALGFLNFLSNETINGSKLRCVSYFFITLSPAIILILSSLATIFSVGLSSFFISGGLSIFLIMFPALLLAPLSLLFFKLAIKK